MSSNYKTLENKALRQGTKVAIVNVLGHGHFTTNGHIMVAGDNMEFKPLKAQDDLRDNLVQITDKYFLSALNNNRVSIDVGTEVRKIRQHPNNTTALECVMAGGLWYQDIYVRYIMAKYAVAKWQGAGNMLVAVDEKDNIIGVIAPVNGEPA